MQPIEQKLIHDIPVVSYERSLHHSKNYYKTIKEFRNQEVTRLPLEDAIEYLLTSELLPKDERNTIERFTVFCKDFIIALHCRWAPTIFNMRNQIFRTIGWYPYVTGSFLEASNISQVNDEWLAERNFNALDWPDFPVTNITLRNLCAGDGMALLLEFNKFRMLLDCCFDLKDDSNLTLETPPDLIYISHAHKDHFASLEAFISRFDGIPLIMSHTTLDLITYFKQKSPKIRTYFQKNAYPLIFEDHYYINNEISFQLFKAGHYPGAAMLFIITPQHKLLYTGDISFNDLQPLKGGGGGIHNLNGPIHSLILEGQFCNWRFRSQKLLLDLACEEIRQTLVNGAPVLILGDPGSWLLIFYLKLFYYLTQHEQKTRIYLDSHTLDIMKILRHRSEDITPFLTQSILRFHDPFASIMRQDLAAFDPKSQDPAILLFDSNKYSDPPGPSIRDILENSNALLIVTGPIRTAALQKLWQIKQYDLNAPKDVKCNIFDRAGNPKHPGFCLHADRTDILDLLHHLAPPHLFLCHASFEYLRDFREYFNRRLHHRYSDTQVEILRSNSHFTLFDLNQSIGLPTSTSSYPSRLYPLITTLQSAQKNGLQEVDLSIFNKLLTEKFPYWKEQLDLSKPLDYVSEAKSAGVVEIHREKSKILVKLQQS